MSGTVVEVREPGRTPLRLVVTEPVTLGRDCEGLLLTDQQISRRHLELRPGVRGLEATDLGSTNGTYLDGERFSGTVVVSPGHALRLGATTVFVVDSADTAGRRPATATIIAGMDDGRRTAIEQVSALVGADLPFLADQEHHLGTITIVFSDIEGSTERVSASGDETWFALLSLHNDVIRRQVRRYGGTEVKNQGDGFMLTFPSARRAVQAMVAVQREFSDAVMAAKTSNLRIRVGMHTGEVIVDDGGDLFGHHVHMASRIAGQATGGEIVVSSLTKALLETRGDLAFDEPRSVTLKGFAEPQLVHPVRWRAE